MRQEARLARAARRLARTGWLALAAACGGGDGGDGGDPNGPPSTGIAVTGTVINSCGQGVAGATVWMKGKGTALSDAGGRFSFANVKPPYDLAIVTPGTPITIAVYQGLTAADVAPLTGFEPTSRRTANLRLTLNGVTLPLGPLQRVDFGVDPAWGSTFRAQEGNLFRVRQQWCSPASFVGSVHALYFTETGVGAPDYLSYGHLDQVALADGSDAQQTLTLTNVGDRQIAGTVTAPAGYTVDNHSMEVQFGSASIRVMSRPTEATTFAYGTPYIPSARIKLVATARDAAGNTAMLTRQGLAVDATGVVLDLSPAPARTAPQDAAAGVDLATQAFTWTEAGAGIHQIFVFNKDIQIAIFTAATSATLPDLATLGLAGLPAGTAFQWNVSLRQGATLDEWVAPGRLARPQVIGLFDAPEIRGGFSTTGSFTTR